MLKGVLVSMSLVALTGSGCIVWPDEQVRPVRVYRSAPNAGSMIVVPRHTGRSILIDPRRQRCYLKTGRLIRPVDCRSIPEARAEFGLSRRATRPRIEPPRIYPTTPPQKMPGKVVNPTHPSPKGFTLGAPPTPRERRQFKEAYKALYCARQTGNRVSAKTVINKLGLEFERYSQIEGWIAKDAAEWGQLSRSARAMCPTKR